MRVALGRIRDVTAIHLESVSLPVGDDGTAGALGLLLCRMEAMGLLEGARAVTTLDRATLNLALSRLAAAGIGRGAVVSVGEKALADPTRLRGLVDDLNHQLEQSPVPHAEWRAMAGVLGADLLGRLVGVSASSLRRYSHGDRATPDDVAGRLHVIAMVVADLAGSYNEYGIRRWFERRRTALGGATPAAVLDGAWDADGPAAQRVRALAGALAPAPAT